MRLLQATIVCLSVCLGLIHAYEDKTVYQYLVDNGYASFARLLRESGLDTILNGGGPFTVFAPTDAALAKVDADLMVSLGHNPVLLKSLLKYHIADGFTLVPQLLSGSNIPTTEGQVIVPTRVGGSVRLNNVSTITTGDVICNNGIVHTIDTVLVPPVFGTNNIAQVILMQDNRFQEFFDLLLLTNLYPLLESGEYTLFAPTDGAFVRHLDQIMHPSNPAILRHLYTEMLKYHMIPGSRTSSTLADGQQLYTLHGLPVNITITASGAMVNQANIIDVDIPASNGVIHAIDDVLFPLDLRQEIIDSIKQSQSQGRR